MVNFLETKESWDAAIISNQTDGKLLVVDFTATWCGPCLQISPKVEELSVQFSENVVFVKVDVDDNDEVAEVCGVNVMPTFQFYRSGERVAVFSGTNAAKLTQLVEEHSGEGKGEVKLEKRKKKSRDTKGASK